MIFWIVCAGLTLAAVIAVMSAYVRAPATMASQGNDMLVYKDQLAEIDTDLARGLIGRADAENARLEVSRRLLKADQNAPNSRAAKAKFSRLGATAALIAIPAIAWTGYAMTGSAGMPDMPIAARTSEAMPEMADLLSKAEAHLKSNPGDAAGWAVIAPIYVRMGRYPDAVDAYTNALKSGTPTVALEIGMGQALAGQNGGMINDAAAAAFQRASVLEPGNPEPKALLATGLAQQGKYAQAKAAFEAMLKEAPTNAPWRTNIENAIRDIDVAMNPSSAPAKGPTQTDVENAASMSEGDRKAMIEGMVANLDAKLKDSPNDPEGWQRLIRSYKMLGNEPKANDALNRARSALSADGAALSQVKALALELGLEKP